MIEEFDDLHIQSPLLITGEEETRLTTLDTRIHINRKRYRQEEDYIPEELEEAEQEEERAEGEPPEEEEFIREEHYFPLPNQQPSQQVQQVQVQQPRFDPVSLEYKYHKFKPLPSHEFDELITLPTKYNSRNLEENRQRLEKDLYKRCEIGTEHTYETELKKKQDHIINGTHDPDARYDTETEEEYRKRRYRYWERCDRDWCLSCVMARTRTENTKIIEIQKYNEMMENSADKISPEELVDELHRIYTYMIMPKTSLMFIDPYLNEYRPKRIVSRASIRNHIEYHIYIKGIQLNKRLKKSCILLDDIFDTVKTVDTFTQEIKINYNGVKTAIELMKAIRELEKDVSSSTSRRR